MTITAPPEIPLITDPNTFPTRAQDWVVWQAEQLYPAIVDASSLLYLSTSATSTTSNSISIAPKTFTVEAGKGFAVGMPLRIANSATNYMDGLVTSYSGTSLVVDVTNIKGTGTFTSWSIYAIPASLGATLGANKFTGAQDFANAVTVASASTVNLNAMASNTGTLTGSTTITAWTLSNGATRRLLCPAGVPLTYNATTNNLNTGGANYTTQTNDVLDITAYGTTIDVVITKQDGTPVIAPSLVTAGNNPTFNSTSDTQPTTPVWVDGKIKALFNVTGSAPLYACRAWVNFNGTGTVAIRGSGNVSSITDNGTGDYTVNFTTSMPDASYSSNVTLGQTVNVMTAGIGTTGVVPPTSTAFRFDTRNSATGSSVDTTYVSVAIFR
jgi:hypothetical protein